MGDVAVAGAACNPYPPGVGEVVSAGIDVVAHVPVDGELDRALAERIAEARIAVGPTPVTIENVLGEPGGAAVAADPRLAGTLGDAQARRGQEIPTYSRAEENVGRLVDLAVTILAGTEPGNRVRCKAASGAGTARPLTTLGSCLARGPSSLGVPSSPWPTGPHPL